MSIKISWQENRGSVSGGGVHLHREHILVLTVTDRQIEELILCRLYRVFCNSVDLILITRIYSNTECGSVVECFEWWTWLAIKVAGFILKANRAVECNIGQVVYTHVPLPSSSIIGSSQWAMMLGGWEGNRAPDEK